MPSKISLSNSEWQEFLVLVDPERGLPESCERNTLHRFLNAADVHGVLPIALRKLSGSATLINAVRHDAYLSGFINKSEISAGITLMLEHYCNTIQAQLQKRELRAVVVKGPVFSQTIYKNFVDRPFTDIDLLAHSEDIVDVAQTLSEAGFNRFKKEHWDRSDTYQEQKWFLSGNPNVMIELHGNLVHYPSLRRRVSFGYKDYRTASQTEANCPLALFMTAVVHASLGHKFHKLQLLVDILQAFRYLSNENLKRLPDVAESLSMRLETALCLKLIDEVFAEERAIELAERIALPVQSSIANRLISRNVLLETHGQSRLCRHAFRWLQSVHWGR